MGSTTAVSECCDLYFALSVSEHHTMKAYWGSGCIAPAFLISALEGGQWSASRPGRFTPREMARVTYCTGGWVGPSAGLDTVVKRKIPSSAMTRFPRSCTA